MKMMNLLARGLMVFGLGFTVAVAVAAPVKKSAESRALPTALMVSDTHFNPFGDPGKVSRLAAAPASEWEAILSSPATPTQAKDFEDLRNACTMRGIDTSYALFSSAMRAIHREAAGAKFITISGDLMAHKFDCMFEKTQPGKTPADYVRFTEKTIEYEALALEHAVPGATFYLSLGNNDSECTDYRLDTGSSWFKELAKVAAKGVGSTWNAAATASYTAGGYYSVEMPAPMQKTRMIVVDDTFLSGGYKTCKGARDPAPGETQMAWLQHELDDARAHHERVWLMGHIPPGVSPYQTGTQQKEKMDLCTESGKPSMFLPGDVLEDTMTKNADVIKLGIFGHTHVDEFKLLVGVDGGTVPLKNVPSITSIGGNYSSFTVAQVDPVSATLVDFTDFYSPDRNGGQVQKEKEYDFSDTWQKEYTFSETYGSKGFTPETLRVVIARLAADSAGASTESKAYIRNYSVGAKRRALEPLWPAYVCGMTHTHADDFKSCVCSGPLGAMLGATK